MFFSIKEKKVEPSAERSLMSQIGKTLLQWSPKGSGRLWGSVSSQLSTSPLWRMPTMATLQVPSLSLFWWIFLNYSKLESLSCSLFFHQAKKIVIDLLEKKLFQISKGNKWSMRSFQKFAQLCYLVAFINHILPFSKAEPGRPKADKAKRLRNYFCQVG